MWVNPIPPWNRRERETTLRKLNNSLLFFRSVSPFPSFFLAIGKEAEGWWEIMREDVGCAGATASFIAMRCNN
jgi:hypothetical protein